MESLRLSDLIKQSTEVEPSVKALLDALPTVAFITDADGATLYGNAHYQHYTGLPAEALMGGGWARPIHPEDREQTVALWLGALALGAPVESEHRLRRADGVYRWFKGRAEPHHDDSGTICRWLGTLIDVDDIKAAEARARKAEARARSAELVAREAEEWLRLAQEASGVGTFEWDPVTIELRWSAECKTLFGLPIDAEVTDDLFLSRVHPDDRAEVIAAIEQTFDPAGTGYYQIEYRVLWPDGTLRWVDARGRATFAEVAGLRRAVKFIGTTFDITHGKLGQTTTSIPS